MSHLYSCLDGLYSCLDAVQPCVLLPVDSLKLDLVQRTIAMSESENARSSKPPARTSSGPGQDATIKFNNSFYTTWDSAKDAFKKLQNGGWIYWAKIIAIDLPDGSFKLQCKCGQSCQLGNPSQFFRKHMCKQLGQSVSKAKHGGAFVTAHCSCPALRNSSHTKTTSLALQQHAAR
jgi:hypothetical protein